MSDDNLFERYKNEVRTKLSVRDLVEQGQPKGLRATGASALICCSPLRADKNPSFSVFLNGGNEYVGYDHATGESFDLFAFIEKRERLSFAEAVKWAGDRVGLPWDKYKLEHGHGEAHAPPPPGVTEQEWDRARDEVLALDERQLVGNVQQAMVDLAHAMFLRSGLPAYVEKRWSISPETQNRFMLGFIPHGFATLLDQLHEQGDFPYGRRKLVKTGWFFEHSRVAGDPNPELRCLFDGRLLYPYLHRGKCRYAAARIIFEQDIEPSYFEKHKGDKSKFKKAMVHGESRPSVSPVVQNHLLYNADNLERSRDGFKRIVIVEGPSDCMAMVEWGYDCVSPVTTSASTMDIPALVEAVKPYQEVVLATDTDVKEDGSRPGLKGALRMAPPLMEAGKKVRLLVFPLPKGETKVDPASWALQWKTESKPGDPFAKLMAEVSSVARGLVRFLDPETTPEGLPEALTEIVKFARMARLKGAEMDGLAKDIRKQLKDNYQRKSILAAMGEVSERADKQDRIDEGDEKTIRLEGAVTERGGFGEPDRVCGYETWSRTGGAEIADFILQPERIIVTRGERLLEVSAYARLNEKIVSKLLIPSKAWTSKKDFKFCIPLEMRFTGSEDNVQGIKQIVADRARRIGVREVRGEPVVGLHQTPAGPRLVMPTETWDENGPMDDPDVIFIDEQEHSLVSILRTDGKQNPTDVDALVKRLMEQIFTLNDPVSLVTVCAWIVGCYFLPQIRELNGGKASVLNVFGSPGAAKTTTIHKILNRTLLPFSDAFEPSTPASSAFLTMRDLSWSNLFCSPFDEFRVAEAGTHFVRVLRQSYSGGMERRGSKDKSMAKYPLVGTVQVSGEQRIGGIDTAVAERLVMVNLSRTTIEKNKRTQALYAVLAEKEKWRVATDIMQWRMRLDPKSIFNWWDQARTDADAAIERIKANIDSHRIKDSCVEMAFRLHAFKTWLGWRSDARVVDVDLPPLDDVLKRMLEFAGQKDFAKDGSVTSISSRSLVARALEEVTDYAISGAFEEGKGWRLCVRSDRRMLVVHPGVMASVLAKETRARGQPDPSNGQAALRQSAREEYERNGDLGWLADPFFRFRMGSKDEIGGAGSDKGLTVARCWLIDIAKAGEQVGLDLDWPGTVAEWGGNRKKAPPPGTVGQWERTGWKGAGNKTHADDDSS